MCVHVDNFKNLFIPCFLETCLRLVLRKRAEKVFCRFNHIYFKHQFIVMKAKRYRCYAITDLNGQIYINRPSNMYWKDVVIMSLFVAFLSCELLSLIFLFFNNFVVSPLIKSILCIAEPDYAVLHVQVASQGAVDGL